MLAKGNALLKEQMLLRLETFGEKKGAFFFAPKRSKRSNTKLMQNATAKRNGRALEYIRHYAQKQRF